MLWSSGEPSADLGAVGGEVLDLAFKQAKPHARFVICGGKPISLRHLSLINSR